MNNSNLFIIHNKITIPAILLFLSIFIKLITKFRGDQRSWGEIKEDIYSSGIEFSVFSLTIFLCEGFIAPKDFFGLVLNDSTPNNVLFSTKFYTITLVVILAASILLYRSYKNDSVFMKSIRRCSDAIKIVVKTIFVVLSVFLGIISVRLTIDLILKSIEKTL